MVVTRRKKSTGYDPGAHRYDGAGHLSETGHYQPRYRLVARGLKVEASCTTY